MSRRDSRENAFMLLYQLEIQKGNEAEQLAAFVQQQAVREPDQAYMRELVEGVRTHKDTLDARFEPLLKRWTKDRLPKVDLTILRLAIYEMFHVEDVPQNVAISEAVLLCRKYTNDESRSYINAVLGRLSRKDQP